MKGAVPVAMKSTVLSPKGGARPAKLAIASRTKIWVNGQAMAIR